MASASENLTSAYEALAAKLAVAAASVTPDIVVDGVSISRTKYVEQLTAQLEGLRALKAKTRRPYYLRSRRRG